MCLPWHVDVVRWILAHSRYTARREAMTYDPKRRGRPRLDPVIWRTNEADVLREMHTFMAGLK